MKRYISATWHRIFALAIAPRCVVQQGWNKWACEYPYSQVTSICFIPAGYHTIARIGGVLCKTKIIIYKISYKKISIKIVFFISVLKFEIVVFGFLLFLFILFFSSSFFPFSFTFWVCGFQDPKMFFQTNAREILTRPKLTDRSYYRSTEGSNALSTD